MQTILCDHGFNPMPTYLEVKPMEFNEAQILE